MASLSEQVRAEPRVRVESVDGLRGLVMVIMALDHVRDFFSNYAGNPTDAASAPGLIFFTRWITHLCAPTFVFLAGTSIYLQFLRKPRPQVAQSDPVKVAAVKKTAPTGTTRGR